MAVTLPNGTVVPNENGGEVISETGVEELRALGASVDAQLANLALLGHIHAWPEITGTESVFTYRGEITADTDLDSLQGRAAQGYYRMAGGAADTHGFGLTAGVFLVFQAGGTTSPLTVQEWKPISTGQQLWRGLDGFGNWSRWAGGWDRGLLPDGTDLNTVMIPGLYQVRGFNTTTNSAFPGESYHVKVVKHGAQWTNQTATNDFNERRYRINTGTVWRDGGAWLNESSGGGGTGWLTGVESTGEWTSLGEETALLKRLGKHREAEYFEVGRSVQNRPIHAVRIGFAAEEDGSPRPTVLVTAGVHANERGTREGALRLIRELIQATTLDRFRVGVIVIPNVNPDGFAAWTRQNGNGVDLNRDFLDATQPETQAVRALIERENIVGAVDMHGGGSGLRVNFIEPDDTRHTIKPVVMERSRRMFDAVWEHVLDNGETPFRYPYADGSDGLGLVGAFHNGYAAEYDIPSLLLELPFISSVGKDDRALPPRVWMASTAAMFAHGAIDVIYRERLAFQAVVNGQSYTIPERHRGQLERSRAASHELADVTGLADRLAALEYDTGRRDIRGDLVNSETISSGGEAWIQRTGDRVYLSMYDIGFSGSGTVRVLTTLPIGFRPVIRDGFSILTASGVTRRATVMPTGFYMYDIPGGGGLIRETVSWSTDNPWPSTYPGDAL